MKRSRPEARLDVLLGLGALGELEPEPSVERKRPWDVGDDDAERVEARGHAASACVRSPSSGAIGRIAAVTNAMCWSSSTPSSSALLMDVVAVHSGGEGRLLQLLPHGLRL